MNPFSKSILKKIIAWKKVVCREALRNRRLRKLPFKHLQPHLATGHTERRSELLLDLHSLQREWICARWIHLQSLWLGVVAQCRPNRWESPPMDALPLPVGSIFRLAHAGVTRCQYQVKVNTFRIHVNEYAQICHCFSLTLSKKKIFYLYPS